MQDWPERFIYVCSAGQAAIVNVLPLFLAGPHRVASVIILLGSGGNTNTNSREAHDPAARLERRIESWSGGTIPVFIRQGRAEDIPTWQAALDDILDDNDHGLPIVLNLKSGTKEMSIGALLGLLGAPAGQRRFVTVSGSPSRVSFIDVEAGMAHQPATGSDSLPLNAYLGIYGFREVVSTPPSPARQRKGEAAPRPAEQRARKHRSAIAAMAEGFLPQLPALWHQVNKGLMTVLPPNGPFRSGPILPPLPEDAGPDAAARRAAAHDLLAHLVEVPGVTMRDGEVWAETRRAAEFIQGGWLEAYLFNRLEAALKPFPRVSVAAGVHIAFVEGEAQDDRSEIGEFDAAVMIGSQLHLVEAKLSNLTRGSENREKGLDQATRWRPLLGDHGDFILMAPRQTEEDLRHAGAILDSARAAGIYPALGPQAVDDTVARLVALAEAEHAEPGTALKGR